MNRISYSQFNQWAVCPHKWKLNYIDKHRQFTDNIHTLFGTSMHEVLQRYLTVMYTESIKTANEIDLNELLAHRMKSNFLGIVENNGGLEFCTKEDMNEFYGHGVHMLDWFKKNRGMYFSKRGYELLGVEIPLDFNMYNNIKFIGYIDVVIKDTVRNRIKIIDIKTSTMGWNKYMKADKNKSNQLLMYKQFYSKQFDIPLDRIDIEYFILKRKLYEKVDFPQRRIQTFVPANGTPSINKVNLKLKEFIQECFTKNGEYNLSHIYRKEPSDKNCRFCEFKNKPDLCDRRR